MDPALEEVEPLLDVRDTRVQRLRGRVGAVPGTERLTVA
jgi:hypothetical protein